jgi:predicted nucleic acid-binding Zn ribbon protein
MEPHRHGAHMENNVQKKEAFCAEACASMKPVSRSRNQPHGQNAHNVMEKNVQKQKSLCHARAAVGSARQRQHHYRQVWVLLKLCKKNASKPLEQRADLHGTGIVTWRQVPCT